MRKIKILQREAPVLRKTAKVVPVRDIKSKKIQQIITKMRQAVKQEDDGVAIAAPQIGESLRIFVVAGRALAITDNPPEPGKDMSSQDMIFINPVLVKSSREKHMMEEGCLSVRWLYGQVKRSQRVAIRAYDENGKKIERGASGLLAQIFQHEVDHLDGILFIDKAVEIEDLPPPNKSEKHE